MGGKWRRRRGSKGALTLIMLPSNGIQRYNYVSRVEHAWEQLKRLKTEGNNMLDWAVVNDCFSFAVIHSEFCFANRRE